MFLEDCMKKKIGLIGCGKLGTSLAQIFKDKNYSIFVSKKTAIKHSTITIISNTDVVKNSDVIFFAIRPQEFNDINIIIPQNKKIISLMAKISIKCLQSVYPKNEICRVMPSIPELNEAGLGICGIYGNDIEYIVKIFEEIKIHPYILKQEKSIDIFTVLVNIPYLFSINSNSLEISKISNYIQNLLKNENINVTNIIEWGYNAYLYGNLKNIYTYNYQQMCATKDGVLAAIVEKSLTTNSLVDIFNAGLNKIANITL